MQKETIDSEKRLCRTCNVIKNKQTDFYIYQGRIRNQCKECLIQKNNEHQKKNKTWRKRNPELIKIRTKKYYMLNREKIRETQRKFYTAKKAEMYMRNISKEEKTV